MIFLRINNRGVKLNNLVTCDKVSNQSKHLKMTVGSSNVPNLPASDKHLPVYRMRKLLLRVFH